MQSSFVKRQVAAGDRIQEHITRGIRMGRDHKANFRSPRNGRYTIIHLERPLTLQPFHLISRHYIHQV
jgi:hypothetical protein